MLHEYTQIEEGGVSVEAGLMAMPARMRTAKLKRLEETASKSEARWIAPNVAKPPDP
jgi:hypothetical protein